MRTRGDLRPAVSAAKRDRSFRDGDRIVEIEVILSMDDWPGQGIARRLMGNEGIFIPGMFPYPRVGTVS